MNCEIINSTVGGVLKTARDALTALYRVNSELKSRLPLLADFVESDLYAIETWIFQHPQFLSEISENLDKIIAEKECELSNLIASNWDWPEVPVTRYPVTEVIEKVPTCAGVYFVFNGRRGRCLYVGQSECLRTRISFTGESRSDGKINKNEWISYLSFPCEQVLFAECFYIGLLKPERNFNNRFRFKKVKPDSCIRQPKGAK